MTRNIRLTPRVYYLPVAMLHLATSVARSNLISLGTCFGKFSKTGKFKLGITSLDWLAKYAKYKVSLCPPPNHQVLVERWSSTHADNQVWVKPSGELPFLYGNHVLKAHLGRITEDTPEHQGVVVFNMADVPLVSQATAPRSSADRQGFGATARSTLDTRKLDPSGIVVFHQADVGEFLRDEDTMF
jgi:60S ribosome subunit biogenesis protein NIP7